MDYDERHAGEIMDHAVGVRCTTFESVIIRDGACFIRRTDAAPEERWSPSTSIAQAWEAHDHLTKVLEWGSVVRTDTMYRVHAVEFYRPLPEVRSVAAADASLPLAICRAALKAVSAP